MPESPVLCRAPLFTTECDQPLGHDGAHHAEVTLPPDINRMLGQAWDDLDRRGKRLTRVRMWMYVATFANIASVIYYLVRSAQ